MSQDRPVAVGLIGLGRAGWGIHAHTISQPAVAAKFRIVAVTDPIESRMAEAQATFGCRVYPDVASLLEDEDIELVVVASMNHQHAEHAMAALRAGKDVLSEKPMATSLADADRMVATARETGRVLTFNHCMRFEPSFQAVRRVIDSGVLGDIVLIHLYSHFFRRRWDWQTLNQFGGGEANNNASHSIDEALTLLGGIEPKVWCDVRRTELCAGDANDHVKIVLSAPGAPTVDIEVTNAAAIPIEHWHILGTRGALYGGESEFRWRYFDRSAVAERVASPEPTPDRSYNHETLPWQEQTWKAGENLTSGYENLYLDLYETIRHGKPVAITPESVRGVVRVLEECRRQCPV